jgi:hypothetical protein
MGVDRSGRARLEALSAAGSDVLTDHAGRPAPARLATTGVVPA